MEDLVAKAVKGLSVSFVVNEGLLYVRKRKYLFPAIADASWWRPQL